MHFDYHDEHTGVDYGGRPIHLTVHTPDCRADSAANSTR